MAFLAPLAPYAAKIGIGAGSSLLGNLFGGGGQSPQGPASDHALSPAAPPRAGPACTGQATRRPSPTVRVWIDGRRHRRARSARYCRAHA